MHLRESGMPEQDYWETFFDVPLILERLGINRSLGDVAEIGCGYGTFTIPIAREIAGDLTAFDIDDQMVQCTQNRAKASGNDNVRVFQRDVFDSGLGLLDESQDGVLLFNILHCEEPVRLLQEAVRVLRPGGRIFVIHWRTDIETPRGPSQEIRPSPDSIIRMAGVFAELIAPEQVLNLPPWHYGLTFTKGVAPNT